MTTYQTNTLTTGSPTTLAGPTYATAGTGTGTFTDLETSSTGARLIGSGVAKAALAIVADTGGALPASGGFTTQLDVTATRDAGFGEGDRVGPWTGLAAGQGIGVEVDLTLGNTIRVVQLASGVISELTSCASTVFPAAGSTSRSGTLRLVTLPGTGLNAGQVQLKVYDVAIGGTDILGAANGGAYYLPSGFTQIGGPSGFRVRRTGTGATGGGSASNFSTNDGAGAGASTAAGNVVGTTTLSGTVGASQAAGAVAGTTILTGALIGGTGSTSAASDPALVYVGTVSGTVANNTATRVSTFTLGAGTLALPTGVQMPVPSVVYFNDATTGAARGAGLVAAYATGGAITLAYVSGTPTAGQAVTILAMPADPTLSVAVDTAAIAEATRASVERTGSPLLDAQTKAGTAATQSTAAATSAGTAATQAGLAKTAADTAATAAGTAATSAGSAATAATSVDGKLTTARAAKLDTVSTHTPADVLAAHKADTDFAQLLLNNGALATTVAGSTITVTRTGLGGAGSKTKTIVVGANGIVTSETGWV